MSIKKRIVLKIFFFKLQSAVNFDDGLYVLNTMYLLSIVSKNLTLFDIFDSMGLNK